MFLDSFYYFIFLSITFLLFHLVNKRFKWYVLLAASLFFIGYIKITLVLFTLLFSVLNYFFGIVLEKYKDKNIRKKIFWTGIILNIGILAFYKYINFIFENINFILKLFPSNPELPYLSLLIPIGISYYTFQALGYLIRINRGSEKAERNFGIFTLFLIFFPKFLSGPVERSNHFLPQIKSNLEFNPDLVSSGLRLFLWGLFKKALVADKLAAPVVLIYGNLHDYSGIPLITVFIIQAIYLYSDFSGYTDMALGSARILGIQLADNFNRPFFAMNVGEFWRRWHMSLSSWCNDFIFLPFIVKYRKKGQKATFIAIFLSFFVIGIWHGANWTFFVLGILQGIAISYEFFTKRKRLNIASRLNPYFVNLISRSITFLFFCLTLIFFNASNIGDAFYYITHMFKGINWHLFGNQFIYKKENFIIGIIAFLFIISIEYYKEKGIDLSKIFLKQPRLIKWTGYYLFIILIYYYSSVGNTFIYLQF